MKSSGGGVVRRSSQVEECIRNYLCNLLGVCSKGSVRAPEGDWSLIRGLEVFLDGTLQLAALDDRSVYRSPGRFLFRFLPFIEVVIEPPHFFSETGVGGRGEGIGQLGEFFLNFGRGPPNIYTPQYLYPPGLIGHSAEIYTPGYTFRGGLSTLWRSSKIFPVGHFLSVYFFSIAPSDGQCRTTSQKISRPGLVAFGRISPKFEHLPWLALIVPPTPFHRRRRHFSSLPTSSPILQFRSERAYFHATMFPSPYTLLGWSNASQTQISMDIDDSKHPTLPKK